MGLFDSIRCKYPLPIEGANDKQYQTKDTPAQFLDGYEIREDGTLWHELYDIEDHSKAKKWEDEHPGEELPEELKGMGQFIGRMSRVNKRWEQEYFDGDIYFYAFADEEIHGGWIEFRATFRDGLVTEIKTLKNEPVTDEDIHRDKEHRESLEEMFKEHEKESGTKS